MKKNEIQKALENKNDQQQQQQEVPQTSGTIARRSTRVSRPPE